MTAELVDPTSAADAGPAFVEEWDTDLQSTNPLHFPDYVPPAGADESVQTGIVKLGSQPVVLIRCRFDHHGGTMGAVTGERIVRAFDRATERGLPVAALVASGGARLQEGMVSLTQMARTASAVQRHRAAGLLTAAVLRPHTTGGVYASWASLADFRAGQPGSTIGFGGPRVVATVTGEWPPKDSHTAQSAYQHGLLDALTEPAEQWAWLEAVLIGPGWPLALPSDRPTAPDATPIPTDGWEVLTRTRGANRPSGLEWAAWLTDGWVELRGPDAGIRAGLATIEGRRVVVIATDRHLIGDAAARPGPDAFRLAQRAVALADQLGLPVLSLVDTPGAEPGPSAEADGIAGEIARTLLAMAGAKAPTVALCVGEGGSGGAMALAHADRFLLLSGAVFSVIGPEAGAAIIYRDAARAPELARNFRMTAPELLALKVVDEVVDETGPDAIARVRTAVARALATAVVGERDERPDRLTHANLVNGANG